MKKEVNHSLRLTGGRKRKGEGLERRQEILEVAKNLFVEEGYERTTIRRIAEQLGISSTALYVYFPDKCAILEEISDTTFKALKTELDRVMKDVNDPIDCLNQAIVFYIRFGLEHPNEYQLTFNTRDDELEKQEAGDQPSLGRETFKRFGAVVSGAVKANSEKELDRVTQQLWTAMHGLVVLKTLWPGFPWSDTEELIAGHASMLVLGVLAAANANLCASTTSSAADR